MVKDWIGLKDYIIMTIYFGLLGATLTLVIGSFCILFTWNQYIVGNVINTTFWVAILAIVLGAVCGLFFKKEEFMRDRN